MRKIEKTIGLLMCFIFLFLLGISSALAATFSQLIELNGTLYLNLTYDDGTSQLWQVVEANGIAYINMTFDDGTSALVELQQYIAQHEKQWSTDIVGGGGATVDDFVFFIQQAISWLKGENGVSNQAKAIGTALNSYFASDRDVNILSSRITELLVRIKALENTMNEIAEDAYCMGKLEAMKEFNLSAVKCGNASKWYVRVNPEDFQGYSIISIEPITPIVTPTNITNITVTFAKIIITNFVVPDLTPGTTANVLVTVKNVGNATGSANISLEISSSWIYVPKEITVQLKPEEETTVTFVVYVPEGEKETTSVITGLAIYTALGNTEETGMEKNVTIKPKVQPLDITGLFLLTQNPDVNLYLNLLIIAAIVVIIALFRMRRKKIQKMINRRSKKI